MTIDMHTMIRSLFIWTFIGVINTLIMGTDCDFPIHLFLHW